MRPVNVLSVLSVGLLLVTSCAGSSPLDIPRQQAMIHKISELVHANYVFPERAEAVATMLQANVRAGTYAQLNTLDGFLDTLSRDMQAAANDKHLRVFHSPRIAAQLKLDTSGSEEVSPKYLKMLRNENFRLRKVESMDGNVGYFRFDNFVELRFLEDAFTGAMNFLSNSAAIIIDLRENGGGAAETSDLLVSYFLPAGTHTGESWNRVADTTTTHIVQPLAIGRQMLDVPLYILVSGHTASAAEAAAYTLQQAKRAIIVGSQTKGMANAGRLFLLNEECVAMIPTTLKRNAISGTNWEGSGVTPDIPVEPRKSLDAAMADALKLLAEGHADNKMSQKELRFTSDVYVARLHPQTPPSEVLVACLGQYEQDTRIESMDGSLWFVQGDNYRRMQYMHDNTFAVEGRMDYRLRFPLISGQVAQCEVLWFDNTSESRNRVQ